MSSCVFLHHLFGYIYGKFIYMFSDAMGKLNVIIIISRLSNGFIVVMSRFLLINLFSDQLTF